MTRALFKDTLREIRRSFGRFLSIFFIVALGVAFFTGVRITGTDMRLTGDRYFSDKNLHDVRILSTLGFGDADIEALRALPGVRAVRPTHFKDALLAEGEEVFVVRVHSLAQGLSEDDPANLSQPELLEGRLPAASGECAVEQSLYTPESFALGSRLRLYSDDADDPLTDTLWLEEYTVVGIVRSPMYLTYERGSSSIGSGKVACYLYVPEEDFILNAYTDMYLSLEATEELFAYDALYKKTTEAAAARIEALGEKRAPARRRELVEDAGELLADGRTQLADAERERDEQVADAQKKLDEAALDLADGERRYADAIDQIAEKEQELLDKSTEAREELAEAKRKLDEAEEEFTLNAHDYAEELRAGTAQLAAAKAQLKALRQNYEAVLAAGGDTTALERAIAQLEAGVAAGDAALEKGSKEFRAGRIQLNSAWRSYRRGEERLNTEVADAEKKLADAKIELADARIELDDGHRKLADAQKELDDAWLDSVEKLADAKEEIAEAEEEIADIEKGEWFVQTREDLPGFSEYGYNADRIDAIAAVFPVFFVLVAALVTLTTMTRMIEEQRTGLGVLRALGYSGGAILAKYLLYALSASFSGSMLGALLGMKIFPYIITEAYSIMCNLPPALLPYRLDYLLGAAAVACAIIGGTAAAACLGELRAVPAALLRPRAPKPGARTLLERIPFFWRRLSFLWKVTLRNLFRYKARILMTVLGVAGCTALLVAGFGIEDSVSAISSLQFGEIAHYELMVILEDEVTPAETVAVRAALKASPLADGSLTLREKQYDAVLGRRKLAAFLFVPEEPGEIAPFLTLRERADGRALPLTDEGAVVDEKLCELFGLAVGDTLRLEDADGAGFSVPITGICENYPGHYVYLTPAGYRAFAGEEAAVNALLVTLTTHEKAARDRLSAELLKLDGVLYVESTASIRERFDEMISSLLLVVLTIVICSGALAFVVLYNLTNINVSERVRELATIKVLGFYDREVSAYIYRENAILTLMGIGAGLWGGVYLHRFIMRTAEIDSVMFGRVLEPSSFAYAAAITALFAVLVNLVVHLALRRIDMVEALKSVE